MRRLLVFTICLFLPFLTSCPAHSSEYVICGPKTYESEAGKPFVQSMTFESRITGANSARLIVVNGDASGKHRASSGWVALNGKEVAGPSDFNQKGDEIEKAISLNYSNSLTVKLTSGPKSFVSVRIIGKYPAPIVHITSPSSAHAIVAPDTLVSGWVETAADHIQVTVNGQRALVNGNKFFVNALPLTEGKNAITVSMEDSYRYAAQSDFTVSSEQQTGAAEWIDLQIDEPGGFAPLETRLVAKPHLAHDLTVGSANLQYQGPQGATVTPLSATEYHLHFDSPGFYTLTYSVANTQGKVYSRQALVAVLAPLTKVEWLTMKGQVQNLGDYFSSAVASMGVQTARLKTLQRALEDPDFSSVVLSSYGTLSLVYQGKIPFILNLPDLNSPPTN